jgi:hypothetical protein
MFSGSSSIHDLRFTIHGFSLLFTIYDLLFGAHSLAPSEAPRIEWATFTFTLSNFHPVRRILMTTLHSTLRFCFITVILMTLIVAGAALAQAQATRTWVSPQGDDVNPCQRTNPCRTFAGALSKTAMGGEVDVLAPGNFGAANINRSVIIDGTGSLASSSGLTINITQPTDAAKTVIIRGISLSGSGTSANGVDVLAAIKVSIENSVIDGFTAAGVHVAAGQVFISNTTIRNSGDVGLAVEGTGQAGIEDVNIVFNNVGMAGAINKFNNVVLYGNKK